MFIILFSYPCIWNKVLSCLVDNLYTEACKGLNKNLDFRCPQCSQPVILKAGPKNIAHFSHKSDLGCNHGVGETPWHRKGKSWMANYCRAKGHVVKFEAPLGNRRTDVLITTQTGKMIAVEFQRKDEGVSLYKRTNDLLDYVNDVVWVLPWKVKLIDHRYRSTATYGINALYSKKNPVKAEIRFYDDKKDVLFSCSKHDWTSYVEQTDFGGGYDKKSRRWCKLVILKELKNN